MHIMAQTAASFDINHKITGEIIFPLIFQGP